MSKALLRRVEKQTSHPDATEGSLGERLRKLRHERALSGTSFAARVGISESGLHYIERNQHSRPTFEVGMRIAEELGVDPWWLLRGEGTAGGPEAAKADRPEVTAAQLAAMVEQNRQIAADMARGSLALAEVAKVLALAAQPGGNSAPHRQAPLPLDGPPKAKKA